MTEFTYMSDLHLEFGDDLELPKGDILLLAGDIGIAHRPHTYMSFLERASENFNHVLMIMGNHEHYHGDFYESYDLLKKQTEHMVNFDLLNNDIIKINDTTIIIGATMWSDISPAYKFQIGYSMNDFHLIKNFSTCLATCEFNKSKLFIEKALEDNKDNNCIVMTHHSPTLRAPEQYKGNILNSAYGSDLEDLILKYSPSVWVHGHTHVSESYEVGETAILCNPRGYVGLETNKQFNISSTFTLKEEK